MSEGWTQGAGPQDPFSLWLNEGIALGVWAWAVPT